MIYSTLQNENVTQPFFWLNGMTQGFSAACRLLLLQGGDMTRYSSKGNIFHATVTLFTVIPHVTKLQYLTTNSD